MTTIIEFAQLSAGNYFSDKITESMEDYKFGLLKICFGKPELSEEYLSMNFMADMSDSMGSSIKRGDTMSKQELMNIVLKNIVTAISKNPIKLNATITGFDDKLHSVQPEISVREDNVADIHANIDRVLRPRGSTNIEAPVRKLEEITKAQLQARKMSLNVVMTDGQANIGSENPYYIAEHLVENTPYAFLGVGMDCDTKMLETLASETKRGFGDYSFIADMEDVAVVIGKHLSEFLFMAASNITIKMSEGAEIYDYEYGEWTTEISVPKMTADVMRTFHFRVRTDCEVSVDVDITADAPTQFHGKIERSTVFQQADIPTVQNDYEIARHVVLKLLKNAVGDTSYTSCLRSGFRHTPEETTALKQHLKTAHTEILCFIAENPRCSSLYNVLADDLFVASQSLTTPFSGEYCLSRLKSNGKASSYNPVNLVHVQEWKQTNAKFEQSRAFLQFDQGFGASFGASFGPGIDQDFDAGIFVNHCAPVCGSILREFSDECDYGGPTNCGGSLFPRDEYEEPGQHQQQQRYRGIGEDDYEIYHTLLPQFSKEHSSEEELDFVMAITAGLETKNLFSDSK